MFAKNFRFLLAWAVMLCGMANSSLACDDGYCDDGWAGLYSTGGYELYQFGIDIYATTDYASSNDYGSSCDYGCGGGYDYATLYGDYGGGCEYTCEAPTPTYADYPSEQPPYPGFPTQLPYFPPSSPPFAGPGTLPGLNPPLGGNIPRDPSNPFMPPFAGPVPPFSQPPGAGGPGLPFPQPPGMVNPLPQMPPFFPSNPFPQPPPMFGGNPPLGGTVPRDPNMPFIPPPPAQMPWGQCGGVVPCPTGPVVRVPVPVNAPPGNMVPFNNPIAGTSFPPAISSVPFPSTHGGPGVTNFPRQPYFPTTTNNSPFVNTVPPPSSFSPRTQQPSPNAPIRGQVPRG